MKTALLTIPGCQPILGIIVKEDRDEIVMEYPVMLIKDDPYVYTTPYVPFAKDGVVSFNKINIISMSAVEDDVVEFYKVVVAELRDNKVVFKKPAASKKLDELKLKQFH